MARAWRTTLSDLMEGGRGGKTADVPDPAAKEEDAAASPLMAFGGGKGRADPPRCGDRGGDGGAVGAQACGCGATPVPPRRCLRKRRRLGVIQRSPQWTDGRRPSAP